VILGVGLDLVHLPDFERQLADPASTFVDGVFTPGEQVRNHPRSLAARYAAKEAFIKAWSNAIFGQPPVLGDHDLREVEVVQDAWGRTALRLHGRTLEAFSRLGPTAIHLSLTHDGPTAGAVVTLSAAPKRNS